ncbi:anti-sigma factor [Roseomonas sp. PWR1]|uniref:Regulator of SigK n=1 Tax=Roseomonas nitratireducens TaxID=2820810 RepID=A0ABS4AYB0_9PROT|nr:anti-sigma factor [Neoroseomonas nitratireducens]MBP0466341.1 anti-sigma factor [Neoroseomonas nitratireducens]
MIPTDPAERDALAGEYVLGTLDARAAAEVARAMETDAALRDAVAAWEARLAPLTVLAPPEAPPPGLWDRIAASLDGPRAAPVGKKPGFWRFWALGATAVAAGLAALLLVRPAPEPRLMTVLLTQRDQPAWLVEADGGALRLASLNPQPVPSDRVMQLWALPQGASAPTSLGLIPAEQGRLTVTPATIRPEPGMLIEITLEPPGGSPTGRPTGPILFIGRLAAARGT